MAAITKLHLLAFEQIEFVAKLNIGSNIVAVFGPMCSKQNSTSLTSVRQLAKVAKRYSNSNRLTMDSTSKENTLVDTDFGIVIAEFLSLLDAAP